jgi:hypothetical protein
VGRHACYAQDCHLYLPAEQIGRKLASTFVRNMFDVKASGIALKCLGCQMQDGAISGRPVIQMAWLGLCKCNEFLDIFGRN